MAIDLSKFAKAFYEEARDHLAAMESLLVEIDRGQVDDESLNALFRAVHSVKGGAAAFGHTELTEFTHDLESILDRVRKHQLKPNKAMITLMLQAGDLMGAHIAALDLGVPTATQSMTDLRAMLLAASDTASPSIPVLLAVEQFSAECVLVELDLNTREYPDELSVARLLEKLDGLGQRSNVDARQGENVRILSFELELAADTDESEVRDTLSFLFSDNAFRVYPVPASQAATDESYGFFAPLEVLPAISASAVSPGNTPPSALAADMPTGATLFSDTSSIRVNIAKVDSLINLVGELVITEAMLAESARGSHFDVQGRLASTLAQLQRNTRSLQESIMSIRMMPVSFIFSRLPRLARDVADRVGKEIELELAGEETELDKGLIEKITDPLIHLVRNAIDHGIEPPEGRLLAGKNRKGKISVRARHEGGMIVISVADDGAGLDCGRILAKAAELGIEINPEWTDQEICQLVFRPGFSTSTQITDVSGRGVGMDVVNRNVESLNGSAEITSVSGMGATMTIRLPLTLAILDGMTVSVEGETYILPLTNISQSMQPASGQIRTVGGREMLQLDAAYIPVISLGAVFESRPANNTSNVLVILEAEGRRVALRVDALLGQHQVVLKSLEENYRKVGGLSGATILGDGRVAFIMDVNYLVNAGHRQDSYNVVSRGTRAVAA
jgi:two-component system chemotaxis sensor kinase CheA